MSNSYLKKVSTLITGTVIAQLIPLALSPLFTRLFSPEQFALFGVFLSVAMPLAILITLRYEASIVLPQKQNDSLHIWSLSIMLAMVFASICFAIITILGSHIQSLFEQELDKGILYLLPAGALGIAFFQAFTYLGISASKYHSISISKVTQSIVIASTQLLLGTLFFNSLIYGFIIGQFSASLYLYYSLKPDFSKLSKASLTYNAKKFVDYPKFNALPSFIDTFTLQLPVLLIATGSDFMVAGYFTLIFRILAAPSSVVGAAIGQVYLKELADRLNSKEGNISSVVISTLVKLLVLAVVFFVPVVLWGEELFGLVFGSEWAVAGKYSEIIVFAIAARFIVSPLSTVLGVSNHMKLGAVWKILYFLSSFTVLYLSLDKGTDNFIFWFMVNELVMYGIYLVIIWYASTNVKARSI